MGLDDLVTVNITSASATPSKPGFGTILIAAQKVPASFTGRVKTFASLGEMVDAGFAVTDPAYLAASRMKAQNPTIGNFKVGKRLLKGTQGILLTCTSATEGDVYKITVNGTAITYTVLAGATTSTVATALEVLIEAVAGVSSETDGNQIFCEAAQGLLNDYKGWSDNIELQDVTSDPGIATDLAAILNADKNWYGLVLDSNSPAEVIEAAAWVESSKKLMVANVSDYLCEDPETTSDVMSSLKDSAYARTGTIYSRAQLLSYSGAAWMAKQFTQNPGSDTWMYKTLSGVTVDHLTGGARSAILAKKGNVYTETSGINMTETGISASGEFLDVTRFVDWLRAEIQFRVFSALVNNSKIPYTDAGVDLLASIVEGALKFGVSRGGLAKGTISVTFPKVADIDSATRATRVLTDCKFAGKLAGAVHNLTIEGSITA